MPPRAVSLTRCSAAGLGSLVCVFRLPATVFPQDNIKFGLSTRDYVLLHEELVQK